MKKRAWNPRQRMQLALLSNRALVTVDRFLAGKPTTSTTRAAIEKAARELELTLPPSAARLAEAS